jgi:ribosome-associated toxin RatA of RatAB toxin-antitoxin module
MGERQAEHAAEVAASPEICFDAAVDYDSVAEWQRAAKAARVLERYPDGLGKVVEWHVDLAVRELRYTLVYSYEPPHRITWDFVEGDFLRDIGGGYDFEAVGGRRTTITYAVTVEPAIRVPGLIARRLEREMMKRSVEDLKREVERRAGA